MDDTGVEPVVRDTGGAHGDIEAGLDAASGERVGGDELRPDRATEFSELYHREFDGLVRLAVLLTGRPEAARDIVQDAFVRLHVRWSTVRRPGAYVRRSVVNGCRSYHRREGRRRAEAERRSTAGEPTTTGLGADHMLSALGRLSDRERAVVVLKFYAQCGEREIADAVGCRPGSVGPTVQRALTKLRSDEEALR